MNLAEQAELAVPNNAQLEPVGPAKAPALMSFEAFCALLAEQPGLKELQLQGAGEPLAHPRFFDMVAYAATRGIEVMTTTTLLTISDARIEECVASGVRRVDVAPGASDPTDCDYLRPGSKLRRALRNAQRLDEAKKRQGAKHPQIRIVLMLLRRNLSQLRELVRLAGEHGADSIVFQHLWHDVGATRRFVEAESLLKSDASQLEWYFSEAQTLADELGITLSLPRARRADAAAPRVRCDRPWRGIHVGASGEALPCARLKTPQRLNLGNMRLGGVVRVWNSEAYREFRERLASDDPPDICRRCAVYEGMVQA
jgi:radical SAM protein with 4Fe4S-binding SPASM domain